MIIRPHFNDVMFDGKSLADFGVHVSGDGVFSSPERDYDVVSVPGRNGDLYLDNGRYKNMQVTYHAFVADDFRKNMQGLRGFLLSRNGYKKIEDSYHPDEYRLGVYKGPLDFEALFLKAAEFDLTFDCKPQRFLKIGDQEIIITTNGSSVGRVLRNPTYFTAKPILRVYGNGQLGISSATITVANNPSFIDIDCDTLNCHNGATDMSQYVTITNNRFPTFESGENHVVVPSGVSRLSIWPRWWML